MKISKSLWYEFDWRMRDSCADDEALYIESFGGATIKYYKLTPTEITVDEYNAAWDRACGDKKETE